MIKSFILLPIVLVFLTGCSPFGGDKETRKLVANGLSSKALYELAEQKVNAGSISQGIKQYKNNQALGQQVLKQQKVGDEYKVHLTF